MTFLGILVLFLVILKLLNLPSIGLLVSQALLLCFLNNCLHSETTNLERMSSLFFLSMTDFLAELNLLPYCSIFILAFPLSRLKRYHGLHRLGCQSPWRDAQKKWLPITLFFLSPVPSHYFLFSLSYCFLPDINCIITHTTLDFENF